MLDLAEGVLLEFSEAQLLAPSKPWGLGPNLHWDNRLARQKSKKALDGLVDMYLREQRQLRKPLLAKFDFANSDGSRWCSVCRRTRAADSFVVQTGRCAGKTVGRCRCCRKRV
jgi:hypothetical protein